MEAGLEEEGNCKNSMQDSSSMQEPGGVCEQSLSGKPCLGEYRQELLSFSAAKGQFTFFITFSLGRVWVTEIQREKLDTEFGLNLAV